MTRSAYDQPIRETLARIGRIGTDPRHVEVWMRIEHGTLDALTRGQFTQEVRIACECIDADPKASEDLARSYGI
jgi:hypothetical protein